MAPKIGDSNPANSHFFLTVNEEWNSANATRQGREVKRERDIKKYRQHNRSLVNFVGLEKTVAEMVTG